jgi:hypothetical protein
LHSGATLPADRCHFHDAAVLIDGDDRDDTTVGEEYVIERAIGVQEDLLAFAANLFKLRHQTLEIGRGKREKKPIAGPTW